MARTIRCTVVKVLDMSEPVRQRPMPAPFHDLLPWADPYIAALVERLRREAGRLARETAQRRQPPCCEAPPPLDVDPPDEDVYFGDDRPVRIE